MNVKSFFESSQEASLTQTESKDKPSGVPFLCAHSQASFFSCGRNIQKPPEDCYWDSKEERSFILLQYVFRKPSK